MSAEKGHAEPTAVALGADLRAAHETIEALVRRYEGQQGPLQAEQAAVQRARTVLDQSLTRDNRALQASEARMRMLLDTGPHMLLTVDRAGRILSANRIAACAFGLQPAELEGEQLASLLDPSSAQRFVEIATRGFEGVVDRSLRLRSGSEIAMTATPLPGFPDQVQIVARDLTWRRLQEEELLHARRLALLGNLAAIVGHEINNPLAVMLGWIELMLQSDLGDPERTRQQLARLLDHGQRIARIVQQLHLLTRPQPAEPQPTPLDALLAEACEAAAPLLGRTTVRTAIEAPGLEVLADGTQLRLAVENLLAHAADRMRRAAFVDLQIRLGCREGLLAFAPSVQIRVSDEGPPLPPDLMEELFASEQRLPLQRAGHVLGLLIVRNVVLQHGGLLRAENRNGGGATVTLDLPLHQRAGCDAPPSPLVRAPRLLCVDDGPLLQIHLERMLEGTGAAWQLVRTGEEALDLLATEDFDAILATLQLPGMSALELHHAVSRRDPGLGERLILLGGAPGPAPRGTPMLPRPFSRLQLLGALAQVSERSGPRS